MKHWLVMVMVVTTASAHAGSEIEGVRALPPAAAVYAKKLATAVDAERAKDLLALLPATLEIDGARRPLAWLRQKIRTEQSIKTALWLQPGAWAIERRDGDAFLVRHDDVMRTVFRIAKGKAGWYVAAIACETAMGERHACRDLEAAAFANRLFDSDPEQGQQDLGKAQRP